jgi:hypothetical protein
MALAAALTVVGLLLVTAIASRKPLSGERQTVPLVVPLAVTSEVKRRLRRPVAA